MIKFEIDGACCRHHDRFSILNVRFEDGTHHGTSGFIVKAGRSGAFNDIDLFSFAVGIDQHPELDDSFFAHAPGCGGITDTRRFDVFNAGGNLLDRRRTRR